MLFDDAVRTTVQSTWEPVAAEVIGMVPVATMPGNWGDRVTVYVIGCP